MPGQCSLASVTSKRPKQTPHAFLRQTGTAHTVSRRLENMEEMA